MASRGCVTLSCAASASRGPGEGSGCSERHEETTAGCRGCPGCLRSRRPLILHSPLPQPAGGASGDAAPRGRHCAGAAPPCRAEPSRHCRVGRGRFAIKRRTGTRFLVLWIFFPHFPSLCFPSGPRSAPGALSRGAPAAMEAAAAGERGRAGRAGERARIPARGAGEVVSPDLRNSFRTTNSSPSGGCPWTHRPALPGGQGDCGAGGFRKSPEDSDNSSLGVLLCPGGPS